MKVTTRRADIRFFQNNYEIHWNSYDWQAFVGPINLRYLKFKPMHAPLKVENHREENVKSCLFSFSRWAGLRTRITLNGDEKLLSGIIRGKLRGSSHFSAVILEEKQPQVWCITTLYRNDAFRRRKYASKGDWYEVYFSHTFVFLRIFPINISSAMPVSFEW